MCSLYYNVLQLPTVGDAKIHNTRRSRVVYFTDDTPRSEAELCMHQIHQEVNLSCVSAHTPLVSAIFIFLLKNLKSICFYNNYKNQWAYLAIPASDIKGLMILKNVLSCFKQSYRSVKMSPRFL